MIDWLEYAGAEDQRFTQTVPWTAPLSKILLHSTEGGSWPGYGGGGYAPHFTIDPRAKAFRRHFPLSTGARALVNAPGGVETNSAGVIQIEIIGSCNPPSIASGLPSVLDFTDDELTYLAGFLKALSEATGIPLETSVNWTAYPSSYGLNAAQRLSGPAFMAYSGVLGHQHVPENDHGDPGNIQIARILEIAGGLVVAPVSHPVTPAPAPAPAPVARGYYQQGDKGTAIEDLQRLLNAHGANLVVDGDFGPATNAAVLAYQRSANLVVDGLVGPATLASLRANAPAPVVATTVLRQGSHGPAVADLQRTLNAKYPAYSHLVVDGDFGPATLAVVEEFQRRAGLTVDGIVGPQTNRALGL